MLNTPAYKKNKKLSTLVLADSWAVETHSFQNTLAIQAYIMALQTARIIRLLETIIHKGFLKLRMSTSEIHLNSLPVSKPNSANKPIALQWNAEIQHQLKISSSISCSHTWTYTCRVTSVLNSWVWCALLFAMFESIAISFFSKKLST